MVALWFCDVGLSGSNCGHCSHSFRPETLNRQHLFLYYSERSNQLTQVAIHVFKTLIRKSSTFKNYRLFTSILMAITCHLEVFLRRTLCRILLRMLSLNAAEELVTLVGLVIYGATAPPIKVSISPQYFYVYLPLGNHKSLILEIDFLILTLSDLQRNLQCQSSALTW